MATPQVTEAQVDEILASGLSISGVHSWRQSDRKSWFKTVIPVDCRAKKPVNLKLVVSVSGGDRSKQSYVLVLNNCIRIRGLCIAGSHGNKHTNDELWVRRTHKHKWSNDCHDRYAYTPDDITENSVNGLLMQFCMECGINCTATVSELPGQELPFDDL